LLIIQAIYISVLLFPTSGLDIKEALFFLYSYAVIGLEVIKDFMVSCKMLFAISFLINIKGIYAKPKKERMFVG